ncbi:hypothetical protein BC830DRAFT_1231006 [Chytriomyces sp. MP71]|nr:hypothetical protein BC830DRAFT_1231006 [Chytriomyces sp. MP71]
MSEIKQVSILAKTGFAWQVWKETQPDLNWFFERNFQVSKLTLRLTGEEKHFIMELDMPNDAVGRLEKSFKDGSLAKEIDKVHGMDPAFSYGKSDAKLTRFCVTMGPARPLPATEMTIEALEQQILQLESLERTRSIDLKTVMENLQAFQVDFTKKMEFLDKKVDEMTAKVDVKCDRLNATLQRYKK